MPIGRSPRAVNSAGPEQMVIEERLVDCADLPVVGGQAPQPRLAAMTGKSLLHDVNERARGSTCRIEPLLGRPGKSRCFHNGVCLGGRWWSQTGSNRRPQACKASALPTELWPRGDRSTAQATSAIRALMNLVGLGGLEPPTSRLSSARSNQLSYRP